MAYSIHTYIRMCIRTYAHSWCACIGNCHIMLFYVKTDCGSNMFGGFNGSECQSCPMDTGNNGGFTASSCECAPGYTTTSDGLCAGM